MASEGLTIKQEKFCLLYVETGNASEAYRKAYNAAKMKPETVNRKAFDLLQNGKITARIAEIRKKVETESTIETVRVVKELACIALADPRRLFHPDGRVKLPHELDAETAASVASIEFDPDGGFKYKLWDKNSSADKLMKYLGGYEKDNKQKTDPVTELLQQLGGRTLGVSGDE